MLALTVALVLQVEWKVENQTPRVQAYVKAERRQNLHWMFQDIQDTKQLMHDLRAKRPKSQDDTRQRDDNLKKASEKLRQLEKSYPFVAKSWLPAIRPDCFQVGQAGFMKPSNRLEDGFLAYRILQVVSASELLVTWNDTTLLLRGWRTTGMTDGKTIVIDKPSRVSGTHKYVSVLGAVNTVFVVEPSDESLMPDPATQAAALPTYKELEDQMKQSARAAAATSKTGKPPSSPDPEADAASKLRHAKSYLAAGAQSDGEDLLKQIISRWPTTKAATEANELLKRLSK